LEKLRRAEPAADPYEAALAAEYRNFAEEKAADCDWGTSAYFADKGLLAAYGRDVQPEDPAHWTLPPARQAELGQAHERLVAALAPGRAGDPQAAARAVADYDRWIALESDGWDLPAIGEAQANFTAALGALTHNPGDEAAGDGGTAPPPESTSTVLYFP